MIRSVPAIIASLGVSIVLSGIGMYSMANMAEGFLSLVEPQDSEGKQQFIDLGQANWMIFGGVALLGFAGWLHLRS